MIIFIDESGDAGFRIDRGSSKFFVVGLIIFDDELDAEEAALILKKFRRELGKADQFEFKFNKSSKELRIKYFEKIKSLKFRIRAIVIEKEKIHSPILKNSKEKFYNYAIKMVLKNNHQFIVDAKIRLDGLGEKLFRKNLSVYLRKELNSGDQRVMRNLRFKNSKTDVLIQLADMVTGAINRSYNSSKMDSKIYLNIFKEKIGNIWKFQ